jgi:serine/threonine-protein kinase HipA
MTAEAARKEINNIVTTVCTWRDHFLACGVSEKDVDYMAQAFLPECFFFQKPPEE